MYGMVWATCMCGTCVMGAFVVLSFAKCVCHVIALVSGMGPNFLDRDIVWEPCYVLDYGCN